MDPELREALNRVAADLRGEVRSADTGVRDALTQLAADLRGEVRSVDADLHGAITELATDLNGGIRTAVVEMRRYFDVVGESLRGDIRAIGEGMVASREQTDRRIDEQGVRTSGLDRRVLRLEVRVSRLEKGREPSRSRRGR